MPIYTNRIFLFTLFQVTWCFMSPFSEGAVEFQGRFWNLPAITTSETVSLALKNEKGLVLIFLSAKCPCSASHEKKLGELAKKWPKTEFKIVGVHSNRDETIDETKRHFETSPLRNTIPVVQDSEARLAKILGAFKTPHAFVYSPQGELLFSGGVDDSADASAAKKEYLADALDAISAGKKPIDSQVRSLGCVIKRD
jgi:hypothetical protein